ncbi:hypothetical protein OG921_21090 [Aldersonia sp. NBC_00410]|uniref:hypothetical protein n=1 Tax=Aldersonia sp. NBC_00410 TaxID=2975954 RepID=UPI0022584B61|nr:hypothetical protein [Aldersonia sp. NBC_00410]MCX5045665.1 hypothetical protein [Aldersonia sp. NBC_00410]
MQRCEAYLEFCGEHYELDPVTPLRIGRDADVVIDDNPYLHRRFLSVQSIDGFWWLINEGDRLPALVITADTGLQASLPPGSRLPLFSSAAVVFTAGPTTYELAVCIESARPKLVSELTPPAGEQTLQPPQLTETQRSLIVALAEPLLQRDGTSTGAIPGSRAAAARLGWPLTTFNRKLDNICDRFAQIGVSGLRGGPGKLASNRRVRLVEFALSTRLVTKADLELLDG